VLNFFILILGSPLYAACVRVLFHINFSFCNSLGDYHFRFLLSLNFVSTYKNGLFSFFCWFWWSCLVVILVYTFNSTVPPIFFNNIIQLKPIRETSYLDGNQENLNLLLYKKSHMVRLSCDRKLYDSFWLYALPLLFLPCIFGWLQYTWVFLRMRFFFLGFFLLFIYYYTSVGNNLFTILFIYLSMSPVISVEITSIESAHYF